MAYYFAVEITTSSYEATNIKKTRKFKNLFPEDDRPYECTLEEIDKFTTEYKSEESIRNGLYSEDAIPWAYYSRPLSIVHVDGIEVRIVNGNILFADSKKYIENPNLVIEYIINKVKERDTLFLRTLSDTQNENSIAMYKISKLATALEEKESYDKKSTIEKLKYPLETKVTDEIIEELALLLIHDCYLNGAGELIINDQIDYEKLHNIVAFISEYEKALEKKEEHPRIRKPQQ